MATKEHKSLSTFRIVTLTITRGSSRQIRGRWEKYEVQAHIEPLEGVNPEVAKRDADALLKGYVDEWLHEKDSDPIHWVERTGRQGKFELATEKNNATNKMFLELRERLTKMGGSAIIGVVFYWLMPDGKCIGRKSRS